MQKEEKKNEKLKILNSNRTITQCTWLRVHSMTTNIFYNVLSIAAWNTQAITIYCLKDVTNETCASDINSILNGNALLPAATCISIELYEIVRSQFAQFDVYCVGSC